MPQFIAKFTRPIQRYVDSIAMYRMVTIALSGILVCALLLGASGQIPYTLTEQLAALAAALVSGVLVNVIAAKLLKIPANHESAVITALIIFFLFAPPQELGENFWIAAASALGVLSKFVFAYRRQHIFNAAAFGAAVISVPKFYEAIWWVALPELFLPIVLFGSLVVMKVRKWTPVLWFVGVALLVFLFENYRLDISWQDSIETFFLSWPALFLAFFMLTEPFTLPGTKRLQAMYGALVGFLTSTTIFIDYFAMTPELALLIGNLAFFPFTLRAKLYLKFLEKKAIALNTYEFVFDKPAHLTFTPGQYLEWTVPHDTIDNRGQRRYFTIASAPEEETLRLAIRFSPERGSSYKHALLALEPGDEIIASQRAGDFVLPSDPDEKLAFVAGGIGVTPFRSFIGHLTETKSCRHATLYYCNNTADEIAYREELALAQQEIGLKTVHVLTREERDGYEHGFLTKDIIERHTPDYAERTWYLSGPPGMVHAYQDLLKEMGVPRRQIKTDFFPGLA